MLFWTVLGHLLYINLVAIWFMELFKIAFGPWEKIFEGLFQGHDVDIYSNPDKILLVLIYEKKLDRVEGAIAELYKVFYAEGETDSFTETLPREVIVITKHDENRNMKFLLLGSKPVYVRWVEDEFVREMDSLIKRIATSSEMIKDISKAYELTLKEIANCNEDIKSAFFTQPMLPPLLATSSHMPEKDHRSLLGGAGEVLLGLTKERKRVVEPLSVFMSTVLNGGVEKDRARVMQVLSESAMLSNVPAVFFDSRGYFAGIGEATKEIQELQKYEVDLDPLGFPLRTMKAREFVKVDLNIVSFEGISELLGIGDKEFARISSSVVAAGKVASMQDFIERVGKMKSTEEFTEYEIFKAARTLRLLEHAYPNLFAGPIEIDDLVRPGSANIARASVIDIRGLDEKSSLLVIYSTLKSIYGFFAQKGTSKVMRIMAVLPSAQLIKPNERRRIICSEISEILKGMPSRGVCFVISAEQQIDIDQEIRSNAEARLDIISGNDAGVQLKNAKAYRVLVRPTLSRS